MLERKGLNSKHETGLIWHAPGMQVWIKITASGMSIGGEFISWEEIEIAKLRARGSASTGITG